MARFKKFVVAAIWPLFAAMSAGAGATSLAKGLEAALQYDPVLRAAGEQRNADIEALPKARADLLPKLTYQAAKSSNTTDQYSFAANGARTPTVTNDYDAKTRSLSLTQPLLRPRSWMAYLQGAALVDAADVTLEMARQTAIDRFVAAYAEKVRFEAEAVAAGESVKFRELKVAATRGLLNAGRASQVDLRQAEATLAQERARLEDVAASLDAASRELERLTGLGWESTLLTSADWNRLSYDVAAFIAKKSGDSTDFDLENHPGVVNLRLRLDAADFEVKKRRSDHSPTLDFVASSVEGTSASDVTIGRQSRTKSVGLQLTIPLYSGGAVVAGEREAVALREKTRYDLENMRHLVGNDRKRTSAQLKAALASLRAAIAAEEAGALAVKQQRMGVAAGLNSNVDVVDVVAAQEKNRSALIAALARTLSLYSQFRLAQGNLDADDFSALSAMLGRTH